MLRQAMVTPASSVFHYNLNRGALRFAGLLLLQSIFLFIQIAAAQDDRGVFDASAYLGSAFDNFAASEVKDYINPKGTSDTQERFIFGFDYEYRLFGDKSSKASLENSQIWLFGETLHGVRSADVDCTGDNKPPVCTDSLDPDTFPDRARFILRNATSLEAFMGVRWEFFTLQPASDSPANLYLKAQAGFLSVANIGGDVVDSHHVGMGIIAVKGNFVGSYVEAGWGRTDLFLDNPRDRWKLDGFLSFKILPGKIGEVMKPFAQITVDSDLGPGSDSVQTYLGVDFDVSNLF